jgi:DinB superfamily
MAVRTGWDTRLSLIVVSAVASNTLMDEEQRAKMENYERQLVLNQLVSSEACLLELVDGLTPEQWAFRETSERWSIAENIEHLILFELFITGMIAKAMEGPGEPDKRPLAAAKQPLVIGLAEARHIKFNSRESVRPTGKWQDTTEMIVELRKARAQTLAFAAETCAPLRDYFFAHIAFGDLDCYQWLLLLGQHSARHALQIEQIKADPAYPASFGYVKVN